MIPHTTRNKANLQRGESPLSFSLFLLLRIKPKRFSFSHHCFLQVVEQEPSDHKTSINNDDRKMAASSNRDNERDNRQYVTNSNTTGNIEVVREAEINRVIARMLLAIDAAVLEAFEADGRTRPTAARVNTDRLTAEVAAAQVVFTRLRAELTTALVNARRAGTPEGAENCLNAEANAISLLIRLDEFSRGLDLFSSGLDLLVHRGRPGL